MDIWEANSKATQIAPHTCNQTGLYECTGDECGSNGVCDKNGCGYNTFVVGDKEFYGTGLTVDTSRPFTVVTQFPAVKGTLQQIRRLYVQDGKVIQNAAVNVTGPPAINYIDDDYCIASGATAFMNLGAVEGMGKALTRGMVLIFSIWWDTSGFMNWLDTGNAGPCNVTEGNPTVIQAVQPQPVVTFSQIKWGELGSTFSAKGY
jgi:cellulase